MTYGDFIRRRSQIDNAAGFEPLWMPDFLYPFQADPSVGWALRKGRAGLFYDCGLGKTPMQLVWAENVARKTGGRVLILTPLAVAPQTVREGQKFGIEVTRSSDGTGIDGPRIVVTNYERLHYFEPSAFDGVVCDESSAIKHFSGARQRQVTEFLRTIEYRLLCTATAAPNDFIELGTSSEALAQLGRMDMLNRFFKNDENSNHPIWWGARWRFKKHAEQLFWQWVCSWARAVRRPSDLGFSDDGFALPPLDYGEHLVDTDRDREGFLPGMTPPARTLNEQREERRLALIPRSEKVAELADHSEPVVCWCHLNPEADLLEKLIPGALQVAGSMPDEMKEERLTAFATGELRCLITKPRIGGFGLNWQHCAHQITYPSHSYEQGYQTARRSWRFGQKRPVHIDIVSTPGERGVLKNYQRKARQAEKMFAVLVEEMNAARSLERELAPTLPVEVPQWLS
ncbi:MAG: helicase [bacterium]|nr:helicase [bacterium]